MPVAYRRPRVRTTPDPLHTLSKRRFEVVAFADDARKERASRRVDAVSADAAKLFGAVVMGIHCSHLVAVELQFSLPSKGVA